MLGSYCVLRRVAIRRAIAAARDPACLTRSQMNPPAPDLHTLVTLTPLWKLDELNRLDVRANSQPYPLDLTPVLLTRAREWLQQLPR